MRIRKLCAMLILAAIFVGCVTIGGAAESALKAKIRFDGATVEVAGVGASAKENLVTIIDGGTYEITGAGNGVQLLVDADKRVEVTLKLNGVSIKNPDDAAIYVKKALHVTVELAEDTQNRLISGEKTDAVDEDASGGALHSKCDLTITGGGALFVGGYINNGIHCTDALSLESGTIAVEAAHHGVKGKDSLAIGGGSLTVDAGRDGLHSEGEIRIDGGSTEITAGDDGAHADVSLEIGGGDLNVVDSTEGLEAVRILISGGTVSVNAEDDGVNANGGASMLGREGEKVPPDGNMGRRGGMPNDGQMFQNEGMPNGEPPFQSGDMPKGEPSFQNGDMPNGDPMPQGDGMQNDESAFHNNGGWIPQNDNMPNGEPIPQNDNMPSGESAQSEETEKPLLRITGGSVYVSALGDGLDSNGDLLIEGGTVIVDGPENGMNGALDSGSENGGVCRASGGVALAIGAKGMAESFDEASTQCAFCWEMDFEAGDEIVLTNADGGELFKHTAARRGGSIVFSSPELRQGETYTLRVGTQAETIEMTEANVTNSKNFFSNPRGFGMPGMGGDGGRTFDPMNRPPEMPQDEAAAQAP